MAHITNSFVAVGDSITAGGVWPAQVSADLGVTLTSLAAHSSAGWEAVVETGGASLIALAPSEVDIFVASSPQPYLVMFAGTNDIAHGHTPTQAYSAFQTYIDARLAAGWNRPKLIVCTMISRQTILDADRATYNTAVVNAASAYLYALARLDLDQNLGANGAWANTTYFSDGIHPTAAGQQIIAGIVESVTVGLRRLVKIGS